jgi:hypothetical protein
MEAFLEGYVWEKNKSVFARSGTTMREERTLTAKGRRVAMPQTGRQPPPLIAGG